MRSQVFAYGEEQSEIRELLRGVLSSVDPAACTSRPSDITWRQLCDELGLTGLCLPENYGGLGKGRVELAIAGYELGRRLAGGAYFTSIVLAAGALLAADDEAAAAKWIPQLAAGNQLGALAVVETSSSWQGKADTVAQARAGSMRLTGTKRLVVNSAEADLLVVTAVEGDVDSLFIVERGALGLTVEEEDVLDLSRDAARVHFNDVEAVRLGKAGGARAVLATVWEQAAIYLAAEQAGVARACLELATEYAQVRHQFGEPIGRFQGVKHRLADMAVRSEMADAAAFWAAWQKPGSQSADFGAKVARTYCSAASRQSAFDAIQVLGGIGITYEHVAHRYLRRAQANSNIIGPASRISAELEAYVGFEAEVPTQ